MALPGTGTNPLQELRPHRAQSTLEASIQDCARPQQEDSASPWLCIVCLLTVQAGTVPWQLELEGTDGPSTSSLL